MKPQPASFLKSVTHPYCLVGTMTLYSMLMLVFGFTEALKSSEERALDNVSIGFLLFFAFYILHMQGCIAICAEAARSGSWPSATPPAQGGYCDKVDCDQKVQDALMLMFTSVVLLLNIIFLHDSYVDGFKHTTSIGTMLLLAYALANTRKVYSDAWKHKEHMAQMLVGDVKLISSPSFDTWTLSRYEDPQYLSAECSASFIHVHAHALVSLIGALHIPSRIFVGWTEDWMNSVRKGEGIMTLAFNFLVVLGLTGLEMHAIWLDEHPVNEVMMIVAVIFNGAWIVTHFFMYMLRRIMG
eukprot:gnl/MRDRNA2_/MRDRNA2_18852_c0_seq1.p1 gnl/MRDRNA2_/MRDRNA2_18852_c0~~gnl/MRDRNA2_/MRDRNA2_18852_c0_seq1.p1  ORF type:complete len:328 (-),score=37.17 gnl/MRDRNA2_/MRDRNA2_18852_c0_seq1:18-911(-)